MGALEQWHGTATNNASKIPKRRKKNVLFYFILPKIMEK